MMKIYSILNWLICVSQAALWVQHFVSSVLNQLFRSFLTESVDMLMVTYCTSDTVDNELVFGRNVDTCKHVYM